MAGWKEWEPLEEVTAPDFQSYIQDQVVQVYANSSARSSALGTAVSAGMISYLTGSTAVEYYNGSSWVSISVAGDITAVTAGTGLTGGGSSGDVTLNVNYAAVGSAILASPTITGTATLPSTTSIGSVSSTELSYLDGVTSAIQTQLNAKQATISGAATTITSSNLTASRAVVSDSSGKIAASSVTSTEVGYLSGVTSAIQTQINTKANTADPTFSGTVTLPSTTSIGSVSATEISYLDGVTSAIQTQLDAKAASNATITINGSAIALGGTVSVGDITSVTAGTGLTGGAISGDATLNVDYAAVGSAVLASPTITGTAVLPSTTSIGSVSNLEISYLDGVTSAIQTQLDAKAAGTAGITVNSTFVPLGGTVTVSGGTGGGITSVTAGTGLTGGGTVGDVTLNVNYAAVGSGISISLSQVTDITASAAELNILDGATLSTTELNYLDGVTSAVQTQLDSKAAGTAGITINSTFVPLGGTATISGGSGTTSGDDDQIILPVQIFS